MKKIFFVIIFAIISICFINQLSFAVEPKEPKLIKETKFDHKIKNFKNNVVVTETELIFLDAQANIRKKKILPARTSIEISKDGTRLGQSAAQEATVKGPSKIDFKMLDQDGEEVWKAVDIGTSFYISPAKNGIVISPQCYAGGCNNEIKIYDQQNRTGKSITPVLGFDLKLTSIEGDISYDGNYFAGIFTTWEGPSDVIFFDISGKQLWSKHFKDETAEKVVVSRRGNFVAAVVKKPSVKEHYLYLFNKQGDLVLKQQIAFIGSYLVDFDNDENYAAAAADNGNLYFIDLDIPSLKWKFFTGDENLGFLDIDVSSGFILASVAASNASDISDGSLPRYIYLFDFNSNLIRKKIIINHGYRYWNDGPKVKLSPGGEKMIVQLPDGLREFANEFAKSGEQK